MPRNIALTDSQICFIVKNYQYTAKELSELLGLSKSIIRKIARDNKVKLKTPDTRKCQVQDDYFKCESEDMFYILGFIAADGNICKNRLTFSVAEKDKELLFNIVNKLESTYCIRRIDTKLNNKIYPQYSTQINSGIICNDLIDNFGITPKKTFTLQFPQNIPQQFISHFVRGYFDGDGCIHIRKDTNNPCIIILGTESFLLKIKELFGNVYGKLVGSIRKRENIHCLYFHGKKSCSAFCKWIYSNSSESNRLERKYEIGSKLFY